MGAVRFLCELPERIVLFLRSTAFRKRQKLRPVPVGNRITYGLGTALNSIAAALNATFLRNRPLRTDFEYVLDASWRELTQGTHRITATMSFGLLLMCICLFITCMYLLQQ